MLKGTARWVVIVTSPDRGEEDVYTLAWKWLLRWIWTSDLGRGVLLAWADDEEPASLGLMEDMVELRSLLLMRGMVSVSMDTGLKLKGIVKDVCINRVLGNKELRARGEKGQ